MTVALYGGAGIGMAFMAMNLGGTVLQVKLLDLFFLITISSFVEAVQIIRFIIWKQTMFFYFLNTSTIKHLTQYLNIFMISLDSS